MRRSGDCCRRHEAQRHCNGRKSMLAMFSRVDERGCAAWFGWGAIWRQRASSGHLQGLEPLVQEKRSAGTHKQHGAVCGRKRWVQAAMGGGCGRIEIIREGSGILESRSWQWRGAHRLWQA